MDFTKDNISVLSFCTGLRGLERGLERVNSAIRAVCYVENEAFVCANLVSAMEAGLVAPVPIFTDLKKFDARPFRGKIHGILAGYPCSPFSVAGLRNGKEDPRHLWPFIRTAINATKPIFVFCENVDDHITLGYDVVYQDLKAMGYLVESGIFSAEEAGSTHERCRLFILAILADINIYGAGRSIVDLLHPQGESHVEKDQRQRDWDEPGPRGEAMADAGRIGVRKSGGGQQSEQPEPDGLPRGNELEYAEGIGQQGQPNEQGSDGEKINATHQWCWPVGTDTAFRGWPAGQGPEQYDYEPPRTIKSRVEYTLAGYNFVGDLHRAIGNSVVEQTAEIAFIHLLKKHLK